VPTRFLVPVRVLLADDDRDATDSLAIVQF
jgi:hypothetical protein